MQLSVQPPSTVKLRYGAYTGEGATYAEALKPIQQASYQHVYQHEAAHLAAAGSLAQGGMVIDTDTNGIATSGHVMIAFGGYNPADPAGSYQQASTAYRAALAPGDPSVADLGVANRAQQVMAQAQLAMKQPKPSAGRTIGWA